MLKMNTIPSGRASLEYFLSKMKPQILRLENSLVEACRDTCAIPLKTSKVFLWLQSYCFSHVQIYGNSVDSSLNQ